MKRSALFLAACAMALCTQPDASAQAQPQSTGGKVKPEKEQIVAPAPAEKSVDTIAVPQLRYRGPFALDTPYVTDSTDAAGAKYNPCEEMLSRAMPWNYMDEAEVAALPAKSENGQMHIAGFYIENRTFAKVDLIYSGPEKHKLFVDGKAVAESGIALEPGTHAFALKYITDTTDAAPVKVSLVTKGSLQLRSNASRILSLDINTQGAGCNYASLSAGGKYFIVGGYIIKDDGESERRYEIFDAGSGKLLLRPEKFEGWMPASDSFYFSESGISGKRIVTVDPATAQRTIIAENIPEGGFTIAPTEDYAIYTMMTEGPKEGDVHQILVPDDRQSGWRNRFHLVKYDFATGAQKRLTFGHRNAWINDISADGRHILFTTDAYDLSKRPTTLQTLLRMDLETMAVDTLALRDGFIASATFSPDGTQAAVVGSAEAFDHIGQALPEGRIPNMTEYQIYIVDIATKAVTPITKDFDPSVKEIEWSAYDGKIYLSADDKDCVNLYRIDPKTAKSERLANQEEYLYNFSISKKSPMLIYAGQSLTTADRVWLLNTKKGKNTMVADFSAEKLAGVRMGEGNGYEFTSSRGDLINCFYVLPPDFDASKTYPMLVHYYGGCSPSARYSIGSYSPQYYAAQGYVFLVVNPSGASGFGQEFASRHVNTAGQGVAEDILEAVEHFCQDHKYVDRKHIGCFSASYGGFMTQLLLAKSDLFATGISHAGISDHTSYWGEGYWGYSYSEVSMANSYPWNAKDLYVDNSPLYMADQIHTPLLFLHGSADINVPIGESIQMFTALKLLGCETAFVVVDGEDHGIRDYAKRRQWLRTISAWFAKYLKEDSTWWDEMYPPKDL